jgi:polysaccharide pyruvyl transferase WcaK-like protein
MIYHVFANRMNIGDWMAARGIQQQLAPRPVRNLLCDEEYIEQTLHTLDQITPRDLVVIGGGGLFMDYFLPFWTAFERAIDRGVPYCIWGVGLCDFKEQMTRLPHDLLCRVVSRADLCVVRDELTRGVLLECRPALPSPVPCPSVLALHPPPHVRKRPALLHAVHYAVTGHERYERMVDLTRSLAGRHCREYLETNNEVERDDEAALLAELGLYAAADWVVSTRLHGCIIGLTMGCKVLAVSGDRKVESFMDAAGLGAWICDIAKLDQLEDLAARLPSQPAPSEFIERARAANAAVGRQVAALADALDSGEGSMVA